MKRLILAALSAAAITAGAAPSWAQTTIDKRETTTAVLSATAIPAHVAPGSATIVDDSATIIDKRETTTG